MILNVTLLHLNLCVSRSVTSDFCSPPGTTIHEIPQARILEWVAIPFSRGLSPPRGQTWVSRIAGRLFTIWATRETKLAKWKEYSRILRERAGLYPFLTIVTLGKFSLFLHFFIFKIGAIVVKTSWYCREDYVIHPHRTHCHSSWDSRTGSTCIIWEFVRNVDSQASFLTCRIRICILIRSPGAFSAHTWHSA